MRLPDSFVEILICPVTRQGLFRCDEAPLAELNRRIADGEVTKADGQVVAETLDEALVTEDGSRLYPVRNGIPVLLAEEAITAPR